MMKNEFANTDWYKDAWIWSFKGRPLSLKNLKATDLDIEEIAHALSNTCRFGGHCSQFYSVAEHCVIASCIVDPDLALSALLHDAAEYMLTDVPKPFKHLMPEYEKYETKIMDVIDRGYNVNTRHPDIKLVDKMLVVSEAMELLPGADWIDDWEYPSIVGFKQKYLACHDPEAAKFAFLERYKELVDG